MINFLPPLQKMSLSPSPIESPLETFREDGWDIYRFEKGGIDFYYSFYKQGKLHLTAAIGTDVNLVGTESWKVYVEHIDIEEEKIPELKNVLNKFCKLSGATFRYSGKENRDAFIALFA